MQSSSAPFRQWHECDVTLVKFQAPYRERSTRFSRVCHLCTTQRHHGAVRKLAYRAQVRPYVLTTTLLRSRAASRSFSLVTWHRYENNWYLIRETQHGVTRPYKRCACYRRNNCFCCRNYSSVTTAMSKEGALYVPIVLKHLTAALIVWTR